MNLNHLQENWADTPEHHQNIHDAFVELVNDDPRLNEHRTWIEQRAHGFGERSFWWAWKLILAELDVRPSLLEIGVYKAATQSLWRLLKPEAFIFGITPLDSSDGHLDLDYMAEIKAIHDAFGQKMPHIIKGRSDDRASINAVKDILFDVVYVDGSHEFNDAVFDLMTYSKFVKKGGYLVIDDCNNNMSMPFGFFQGIQPVTDAKLDWLNTLPDFEFIFSVVHISVFKRK